MSNGILRDPRVFHVDGTNFVNLYNLQRTLIYEATSLPVLTMIFSGDGGCKTAPRDCCQVAHKMCSQKPSR